MLFRTLNVLCFIAFLLLANFPQCAAQESAKHAPKLSAMGQIARDYLKSVRQGVSTFEIEAPVTGDCTDGKGPCLHKNLPTTGSTGTQAEVSIAVDATGQHIVIGFNDFRGFSKNPVSTSGFMYSDNGGQSFTDGGQLPSPGNQTAFGLKWPQILGDPDVKYLGGCNFIYSSLMVKVAGDGLAQTLAIHRSTDCGHTWSGPIEVTPATNPGGLISDEGDAEDAADKELIDVDPDTGRVLIGWSNFTPSETNQVEISVTYTDNIMDLAPTFAPRRVVAAGTTDGQGSSIRAAGNGSPNVYIAWERETSFLGRRIAVSRSTDNGVTWSAPSEITSSFVRMDEVPGNDRINEFPSLAVDKSAGPYSGNLYIVYSNNSSRDGADIAFQRSTNSGISFSAPVFLNSNPGRDRAQWFPFVSVDKTTGRVIVFYYDQSVASSGDLTQVTYLYSDDGGVTWSSPAPLDRTFKAGWGNDANEPNLGDYNQSVAQSGIFYAAYAATRPQKFTDGQPSTSFNTPDVYWSKVTPGTVFLPVRAGALTVTDSGGDGRLDPGDTATLKIAVTNSDQNPLHSRTLSGVSAVLSTSTPGVSVTQAASAYPSLEPGASGENTAPFAITLAPSFVPGTPIEFQLALTSGAGASTLSLTQPTGSALTTTLLTENFENVPAPNRLPAGWTSNHGSGANTIRWTTSSIFCGSSNKAFHENEEDGPGTDHTRWERLFSPTINIPADSDWVEVEFDICTDSEDEPSLRVAAYDGFFLRIGDLTPGRTTRSALAEAFEEEFTTGAIQHYPKHLPSSDNVDYFGDMSVWAGDSQGYQHVRMKLPGMAGSTVQLRFEYTQDEFGTCADVRPGHFCGVAVDNVVVRSARAIVPPSVNLTIAATLARDNAGDITAQITVKNIGTGPAQNVRLTSAVLGSQSPSIPLPVIGSLGPNESAVITLTFPASAGTAGQGSLLRINGLYDGGTWGGSLRVAIP